MTAIDTRSLWRLFIAILIAVALYFLPLGMGEARANASDLSACQAIIEAPSSASGGSPVAIIDKSIPPKGAIADIASMVLRGWVRDVGQACWGNC